MKVMISKMKLQSQFSKNILKLASSSIFIVLISLISLPIVTRIYDPSVFGEFQVLVSTIGIISIMVSFKYEMAIVLPKNSIEANAVYSLSIILLLITTTVFSLIFYFFGSLFLSFLNAEELEPYLILLIIGIFLSGLVQICGYILTREKNFHRLGNNRVIESISAQGMKIGLGLISPTFLGLFISQLVGYLLNIYLTMKISKISFIFSKKKILVVFRKYNKFLLYSTPAMFINTIALQLPVFFIVKYFGVEFVGYYILAIKLIDIPLGIIGNAISQVYYKEAADQFNIGVEKLFILYKSTLKKLIFFIFIPSILIYTLAESLVPYILGDNWSVTGQIISILVIWKSFEFINAPISTTLMVLNKQNIDLFLKIFLSFGLRLIVLMLFNDSFIEMMYALTISAAIYYGTFNLITYFILRRENEI